MSELYYVFNGPIEYGNNCLYVPGKVDSLKLEIFFLWNIDKLPNEMYASIVALITKDTSSMVENWSTTKVNRTEAEA